MTTDPQKVWADRAKAAVTTPKGSRIMRPSYGSPTPLQLFGNTEDAAISIDSDTKNVFSQWLPELKYQGVDISSSPETAEVFVSVKYSTPVTQTTDQVTVSLEY